MIPQYSIQEWHEQVPWNTDAMVEQDLIICRALISIFNDEFLASQLALRCSFVLNPRRHLCNSYVSRLRLTASNISM